MPLRDWADAKVALLDRVAAERLRHASVRSSPVFELRGTRPILAACTTAPPRCSLPM